MSDKIENALAALGRARITAREGAFYVRADAVKVGDLLDLAGDPIADPNGDGIGESGHFYGFEYELCEVEQVEIETIGDESAAVLYMSVGAFGFPLDHELEISLDRNSPPAFYLCGICGHRHLPGFAGDCRDDVNRFTDSELDDELGPMGTGWLECDPDGREYI